MEIPLFRKNIREKNFNKQKYIFQFNLYVLVGKYFFVVRINFKIIINIIETPSMLYLSKKEIDRKK